MFFQKSRMPKSSSNNTVTSKLIAYIWSTKAIPWPQSLKEFRFHKACGILTRHKRTSFEAVHTSASPPLSILERLGLQTQYVFFSRLRNQNLGPSDHFYSFCASIQDPANLSQMIVFHIFSVILGNSPLESNPIREPDIRRRQIHPWSTAHCWISPKHQGNKVEYDRSLSLLVGLQCMFQHWQ